MRKYDLCIGGYAGCGNLGDDAILEGYLASLSAEQRKFRTVILTGRPRRDGRRFGVRCVGRKNLFSIFRCFLQSKVFVCGGGSPCSDSASEPRKLGALSDKSRRGVLELCKLYLKLSLSGYRVQCEYVKNKH